jgi:hypothetical protein
MSDYDFDDSVSWLCLNGEKYAGKWVALLGGTLIDSDLSRLKLQERIVGRPDLPSLLVFQVEPPASTLDAFDLAAIGAQSPAGGNVERHAAKCVALAKELRAEVERCRRYCNKYLPLHVTLSSTCAEEIAAALSRVPKLIAALREIGHSNVSLNPGNLETLRELSRLKAVARAALEGVDSAL